MRYSVHNSAVLENELDLEYTGISEIPVSRRYRYLPSYR